MSSIIDDGMNWEQKQSSDGNKYPNKQGFVNELSKKINNSNGCLILKEDQKTFQCTSKIQHQQQQYDLKIIIDAQFTNLTIQLHQISPTSYRNITSRNHQISLIQKLASLQFVDREHFILYVQRGSIFMRSKITLSYPLPLRHQKLVEFYYRIIVKDIIKFHNILASQCKRPKESIDEDEKKCELLNDLLVALTLNKTEGNFDYTTDKAAIRMDPHALRNQRAQIKRIEEGVVVQKYLQNSIGTMYQHHPIYFKSQWVKENIKHLEEQHNIKYKKSLLIPGTQEKRRAESHLKLVKLELKQLYKKPIAQGGSSLIHCAKMLLTFINSQNKLKRDQEEKQEKIEKTLVVKSLKPELQKILKDKLLHQKAIVGRFQEENSYFLPKYYNTEKMPELTNSILMEYVNGQQLDAYLKQRQQSISLRTKVYLLLNIIFAIRHLVFNQIVHLDLKPINIMICKQLITKIIDYGQAYHKQVCIKNYTPGFTFPYVAPQVFIKYENQMVYKKKQEMVFSEKQDCFAFGMIMYETLFGSKPFNFNIKKYKQVYGARQVSQRLLIVPEKFENYQHHHVMSAVIHNIGKCLDVDPSQRPKIDWMGFLFKLILNFYQNR